jgi:hypothetical protein
MPQRLGVRVEVGVWMGVLFRDGTDKRCEGNIVIFFCSNTCKECFKLPCLGCLNDEKNVF